MRAAFHLLLTCASAFATEKPIGTLITSDPFEINGTRFGAAGVYSWPVFAQDRIKTESSTAAIYLPELGELSLDRDTSVQFAITVGAASVTLLNGRMGFCIRPHSRLRIVMAERAAGMMDSAGVISRFGERVQFAAGSCRIQGAPQSTIPPPLPSAGRYLPEMTRAPTVKK